MAKIPHLFAKYEKYCLPQRGKAIKYIKYIK